MTFYKFIHVAWVIFKGKNIFSLMILQEYRHFNVQTFIKFKTIKKRNVNNYYYVTPKITLVGKK